MAYTDEQLIQMSQGVDVMGVTGQPQQAPVEPAPEADFDEVVETTEEVVIDGDSADVVEEQKPMNRTQKRITQLNEKAKQAEARAQQLEIELQRREFELQQKEAALDRLIRGTDTPEKSDGKKEYLDEDLAKDFMEFKAESRVNQEHQIGMAHLPNYDQAHSFVIAKKAQEIMLDAEADGMSIPQDAAIAMAHDMVKEYLYRKAQKNKNVGSLAKYVYNLAVGSGFTVESKKTDEPKIDMKAVQRVRDEAGAPTIQKEPVIQGGAQWRSQVEKMAKAGGASDDALARALGKRSY